MKASRGCCPRWLLLCLCGSWCVYTITAFLQHTTYISFITRHNQQSEDRSAGTLKRYGWLRDFFEPPNSSQTQQSNEIQYPELYPATYDLNPIEVADDNGEALVVRPLLKNTQLQTRSLTIAYDANISR